MYGSFSKCSTLSTSVQSSFRPYCLISLAIWSSAGSSGSHSLISPILAQYSSLSTSSLRYSSQYWHSRGRIYVLQISCWWNGKRLAASLLVMWTNRLSHTRLALINEDCNWWKISIFSTWSSSFSLWFLWRKYDKASSTALALSWQ